MANTGTEEFPQAHYLYICPYTDELAEVSPYGKRTIPVSLLEDAIKLAAPQGEWLVTVTSCGLIVQFANQSDVDALQRLPLGKLLGGPVKVSGYASQDFKYKQAAILKDIPMAVQLRDLSAALEAQGIQTAGIQRVRKNVKVELTDPFQYEKLLQQGLDFFGTARFTAYPEYPFRGQRSDSALSGIFPTEDNRVLQCYQCQGFWHIAEHCRQQPRCVRCGEGHSLKACPRPRNDPHCCHCGGPHHAAYKGCPLQLELANAIPLTLTLSARKATCNRPARRFDDK